jgi:Delta24-sterol reductase
LEFIDKNLGIYPLWILPLKPAQKGEFLCSHALNTDLVLNVGVWGRTDSYVSDPMQKNKDVEKFAMQYGGRKILYAHQYYEQDKFWDLYDKEKYERLREKYHAKNLFPDLYSATHVSQLLEKDRWAGFKAVSGHIFYKAIGKRM